MKKNTKIAVVVGLVVLLGAGGGFGYYNHLKTEQTKQEIKLESLKLKQLQQEVNKFYESNKKDFLAKDLKKEEVVKVEKQVDEIKVNAELTPTKNEVKNALKDVSTKLEVQTQINNLYEKPVINGSQVVKDVPIKANVDKKQVEAVKLTKANDAWTKAVTALKTDSATQVKNTDDAKKAVKALEKDRTPENLAKAQEALNKVKNTTVKKDLNTKVEPVKKEIETKVQEQQAKQQADAQTQTQAQQQSTTQAQGTTSAPQTQSTPATSGNTGGTSNNVAPRQSQPAQSSNNGGGSSTPSQPAQQPSSNRDSVTFDGKTYTEDKDGNGTVDGWDAIFSDYAELGD
ncbi:cell division site-positioning protein MapZ family protein [Enterococcus cecorum]|uniref:cell division site-positioning protein MapZ family protein n=1 Tax=Enterococcus cecorum TaxID=44008 RepID=UPI001FAE7393|nr:cell division site-positioning protein MapZ family protein [Enterococcus cecorum]MCJ0588063.1 cell division site-positioning protein MapZ family protein [Enterococcus cecorum]MCJ0593190.1 cell division site-positioning protein MapZ family protein [Enterococcus cecorum]